MSPHKSSTTYPVTQNELAAETRAPAQPTPIFKSSSTIETQHRSERGWSGEVDGTVAAGYEAVVEAVEGCGPGVTVAAFVDGQPVVDIWTDDLTERSLLCTWSAVKPITGSCLLLLVERGAIGLDDQVTSVWPELGDDRLLIRHLLSHTAGRVSLPDVPLTDWDRSIAALAAMDAGLAAGRGHV